jgi:hypothetical protein
VRKKNEKVSYREDRQKSKKKEERKGKRKEGITQELHIYIYTYNTTLSEGVA